MNRKKRMSRKKLTLASLVAIPVVAGLAFAITGSAFAGTNGQQIQLCQELTDYSQVFVTGTNQDGVPERGEALDMPQGCKTLENAWWKGEVTIEWQTSARGLPNATTTCDVPEVSAQDSFPCYGPQD